MSNATSRLLVVLGIALALAACGQPIPTPGPPTAIPSPFPIRPKANITLTTNPAPPVSGEVELIVTVTDESGQPVNNAVVFVFADHTDMPGMGVMETAAGQGEGRYTLKARLGMSGDWKFSVQVKKPPLDVDKTIRLRFQ